MAALSPFLSLALKKLNSSGSMVRCCITSCMLLVKRHAGGPVARSPADSLRIRRVGDVNDLQTFAAKISVITRYRAYAPVGTAKAHLPQIGWIGNIDDTEAVRRPIPVVSSPAT
jgi:hypothetical protein